MVAFRTQDDILAVPLTGGPARTLVDGQLEPIGGTYFDWGADDRIYFTSADDFTVIRTIPAQGGEGGDFSEPYDDVERVSLPHALPEGKGLLVTIRRGTLQDSGVGVVGPEGGEVREILPGVSPRYLPPGHILFVNALGTLMSAPFDADRLEVTGPSVPIVEDIRVRTPGMAAQYAVSASGSLVYRTGTMASGLGSQLAVVDLAGNLEALALAPRRIGAQSVRWSPDGESIVFESQLQIYTYNTVLNTAPRQITFDGSNFGPVYSPDGTQVAFSSERDGTDGRDLFVKDLNDDAPPRSIITLDADQSPRGWPADTLIVLERAESGSGDLWMLDISDPDNPEARPYLTSEANLRGISVSPDGTLAAYRSDESGQNALYLRSFPTPGERTIAYSGGGSGISWSPDGGTLYTFTTGPVIAVRLRRDPVPAVLGVDTLFTNPANNVSATGRVLHPDGDRFILGVPPGSDEEQQPDRLILVQNFFEELRQRMGGER
jgi:hypothetical protein